MSNIFIMPVGFWISVGLLALLAVHAWSHRSEAWGIPALAVYGTVLVWYHGDAIYNDYLGYQEIFSQEVMNAAWWQVTWFVACFGFLTPVVHRVVTPNSAHRSSYVTQFIDGRGSLSQIQPTLKVLFKVVLVIWLVVSLLALVRTSFEWQGLFFPWWCGYKAYPWSRGRIGGGIDFLFSAIEHINVFCLAVFGVVAVLTVVPRIRTAAIVVMVLSWPYYLLDRTRSTMLVLVLPTILAFVFVRCRRRPVTQYAILLVAFVALQAWFGFVATHRSSRSIVQVLVWGGESRTVEERHPGLNMYEELCCVVQFQDEGLLPINWGRRYFAEFVNPIPRSLWPGKPMIGVNYAVARGQKGGSARQAGINASISTGMIGQGTMNFGPWGGPAAAALLMALWCAMLARFDLNGRRFGRIPLYLLGCVLTFNFGRDITFLVAYPLIFGYLIVRSIEMNWILPADVRSVAKTPRFQHDPSKQPEASCPIRDVQD